MFFSTNRIGFFHFFNFKCSHLIVNEQELRTSQLWFHDYSAVCQRVQKVLKELSRFLCICFFFFFVFPDSCYHLQMAMQCISFLKNYSKISSCFGECCYFWDSIVNLALFVTKNFELSLSTFKVFVQHFCSVRITMSRLSVSIFLHSAANFMNFLLYLGF